MVIIMSSIEILAMLCAGSTRYHAVGGRSFGGDRLSGVELAGLLSGLGDCEINFVLAKYMGDMKSEQLLIKHVLDWLLAVAWNEHWKIIQGRSCLMNMAELAVFEVVRPNRCDKCGGGGYSVLFKLCKQCQGSGYARMSGRSIAEAIGIDEGNYRRVWKDRFNRCVSFVQVIDSEVNSRFCQNSSKETDCNRRNLRV